MARDDPIASHSTKALRAVVLPSIGDIIFISVLFVLAFNSAEGLLGDGDTGSHIRTGEIILQTWKIPTQDPYSFHYPPLRWTAHEWLAEVIMAVFFGSFGLTGVVLFFAFVLALTHWLLYRSLRTRSNDILLCVIVALLATTSSSIHWLARPHIFSLLFTVLWCDVLDRFQYRNQNKLIYLPLLMLLWVNLHGGFIVGLVFLSIYLIGNAFYGLISCGVKAQEHFLKAKKLGIILITTIIACLMNPAGIDILWFPIRVTSDRFVMDWVSEFMSPNFHGVLPFKYMLIATIGALALSRSALNVIEATLILLLSYMALYSARHVSLFALVVAPILLRSLESILSQLPERTFQLYRKRIHNLMMIDGGVRGYFWPVVSILLILALGAAGTLEYRFSDKKFPVAAVEFLKTEPVTGKMFNNDEFGDYLIFTAWPAYRVFMDGRSDMYGERFGSAYFRVANAQRGWKEVLEKHDITWVFFDTDSPLTAALQEQKDWQPIYSDRVATIFLKKVHAHRQLLEKYPSVLHQ